MGPEEFAQQLRTLGYNDVKQQGSIVTLPYTIPIGSLIGKNISLGFTVPANFPMEPPGGPCVDPPLGHPNGSLRPEPSVGPNFEYWSRPFPNWPSTPRDVATYMGHVRHVFSQR
jgi:hypothetical protein